MSDDLNHVMEFSSDGKLFAYIDEAGKLKIWDTERNFLKQEYIPNLHLASPITCLKWIEVGEKKSGSKKTPKKKLKQNESKLYLVLGTNKGKVVLYSYADAQIEREFQGTGHSDAVTDLFYDDAETIYSCGADSKVIKWNLGDGCKETQALQAGKQKLTAIAVVDNFAIVASRAIKVYDMKSETCIKTFTGHSGTVTTIKTFTNNEKFYFLSISKTERIVSMWCLDETDKTDPIGSFVTDDCIIQINFNVTNDQLQLTAVNRIGVLQMYVQDLTKLRTSKPVKKRLNVQIVSEAVKNVSEPIQIIACLITAGENELLVAYGDRMLLKFEHIQPDHSMKENVLVRQNPKKFLNQSELDAQKPHNVVVPLAEKGKVEYLNQVTAVKKDLKPIDTPLQTRLENMSIGKSGDEPPAKNMVRLLIQGLHSKDANILRTVFQTKDPDAVRSTLEKLPPQYIKPLVNELSLLMQKKTTNVQLSIVWLKTLIQTQTSQLMALGSDTLKDMFGLCLGIVDHRMNDLPALMMLKGRMDLIASQLERKSYKNINNEIDLTEMLVYEDKSDDENLGIAANSEEENLDWDDSDESESEIDGAEEDDQMNVGSSDENTNSKKSSQQTPKSDEDESDDDSSEMDTD